MKKPFQTKRVPRCIHRHTAETHRHCFNPDGSPKTRKELKARKLPKVLLFDIETSPLKAYIWQKSVYNSNISEGQVLSEWFMLCWSAKWLFDDTIISDRLTSEEALDENDSRIVSSLWKLLDSADIVIAHNGSGFDIPNMNTRFIVNKLPPPSPFQIIDTVQVARRQFGFTHNNLNALARVLGFKTKQEMSFEDWKRCVSGNELALKKMLSYNRDDVSLLEEVYVAIRPWIKSHPNMALYYTETEPICSNCGSTSVSATNKYYYTQVGRYDLYRCECGAFIRVRTSNLPKEKRDSLLVSIAK